MDVVRRHTLLRKLHHASISFEKRAQLGAALKTLTKAPSATWKGGLAGLNKPNQLFKTLPSNRAPISPEAQKAWELRKAQGQAQQAKETRTAYGTKEQRMARMQEVANERFKQLKSEGGLITSSRPGAGKYFGGKRHEVLGGAAGPEFLEGHPMRNEAVNQLLFKRRMGRIAREERRNPTPFIGGATLV